MKTPARSEGSGQAFFVDRTRRQSAPPRRRGSRKRTWRYRLRFMAGEISASLTGVDHDAAVLLRDAAQLGDVPQQDEVRVIPRAA